MGAAAGADGSGGSSEAGAGEGKVISSGGGEFAFFNREPNNLRDYFQTISLLQRWIATTNTKKKALEVK